MSGTDINEVIRQNEGLVWAQLKKFGLQSDDEAWSVGMEALYRAVLNYSDDKGSAFSTYATICVYNALGSYVRSINTLIRKNTISYDVPVGDDGGTHLDTFKSKYTADGRILSYTSVKEIMCCIGNCLETINNEKQRKILDIWIESNFAATHKEISSSVGCSQSYVSQTINRFRTALKKEMEDIA